MFWRSKTFRKRQRISLRAKIPFVVLHKTILVDEPQFYISFDVNIILSLDAKIVHEFIRRMKVRTSLFDSNRFFGFNYFNFMNLNLPAEGLKKS